MTTAADCTIILFPGTKYQPAGCAVMDEEVLSLDVRAKRLIARCRQDIESAWAQIEFAREGLQRQPAQLAGSMKRTKHKLREVRRSLAGGLYAVPPSVPSTESSPRRRPTLSPTRRIASKVPPT